MKQLILIIFAVMSLASNAFAASVTYTLDNVFQNDGGQLTGTFVYTYDVGDFENGNGVFTEISVPGYGTDLTNLVTTIDSTSIEISLAGNINNQNLGTSLKFSPLTPLTGSDVNLISSKWENNSTANPRSFVSGSIGVLVPIPAAVWLFGSGLLGLIVVARRKT